MKTRFLVILLFIVIFTHWRWFANLSIFTYGDWWYHFSESTREWLTTPLSWRSQNSLGGVNLGISGWPYMYIYGILGRLGFSSEIPDRILFLIFPLIVSALSSFFLIYHVTKSRIASLVGSFVYLFNTYFMVLQTSHLTLMAAFSFSPLAILLFIKSLEEKKVRLALLTGIILSVVASYEFRAFYIVAWVCLFYFLWHLFIDDIVNIKNALIKSFLAFFPIFIVILLNSYWLLGAAKLGLSSSTEILSRALFGSGYMNIWEALTIFHPFWTGSKPAVFVVQPIPMWFYLIPLFSIVGLLKGKKNTNVLFFGLISILGILLAKQQGLPFPDLYQWLYEKLPGFNAFRESSKFYFLIALGYSILIGSFVDWVYNNHGFKKIRYGQVLKVLLLIIPVIIFLVNSIPLITADIDSLFVARTIPNDYLIAKKFILSQDSFFRTLWVPTNSRWSIYSNNHPSVSWLYDFDPQPDFSDDNTNILMDTYGIKYVFIPLQDTANDDDFFSVSRDTYVSMLNKASFLKPLDIGTKNLLVYENVDPRSHLYITDQDDHKNDLQITRISSVQYKINIKSLRSVSDLNFSESYHPGWKIISGSKNELPASAHINSKFGTNIFQIDPSFIKNKFPEKDYVINNDGSIDIDLDLYFSPQSGFNFWFKIAKISFGTIVSLLFLDFFLIFWLKNNEI